VKKSNVCLRGGSVQQ